jgi:hypothetical protein
MKIPAGDEFYDALLRFRIVKPQEWRFREAHWSPAAQVVGDPYDFDWRRYQSRTFVELHKPVEGAPLSPDVRVAVEWLDWIFNDGLIRAFLDRQVAGAMRRSENEGVALREATTEKIAGHYATRLMGECTLYRRDNGFLRPCRALNRTYSVFAHGLAYTVEMTSSIDDRFFDEGDFEDIIRSIEIGRPGWRED